MLNNFKKLYFFYLELLEHISFKRKTHLLYLLFLILASAASEIVTLGSIFPFLSILINPAYLIDNKYILFLFPHIRTLSHHNLILLLAIFLSVAAILSGILRLSLAWATSNLSLSIGRDLSLAVYRQTLYQNYEIHLKRNSSVIIDTIVNKINQTTGVVFSLLNFFSALISLIFILISLLFIKTNVLIFVLFIFGLTYFFIINIIKNKVRKYGEIIALNSSGIIKSLQESLGNIKDIILDQNYNYYIKRYEDSDRKIKKARANTYFLSIVPRYALETFAMVIFSAFIFLYIKLENDNINAIIPTIGLLALAAQRLLPILQQLYQSFIVTISNEFSARETLKLLNNSYNHIKISRRLLKNYSSFKFNRIDLINIDYFYSYKKSPVIQSLNLTIKRGDIVGIVGPSGVGKSTLLNILMGLLKPKGGIIRLNNIDINDKNRFLLQSMISHVPQDIYLSDSSIRENIALGVELVDINDNLVKKIAEISQLSKFIERLPLKFDTLVGERGAQLSGGQLQRIGIARALYKQNEILILDEATNALDSVTEDRLLKSINSNYKHLTLIIISHRQKTLKYCNKIFDLSSRQYKTFKIPRFSKPQL